MRLKRRPVSCRISALATRRRAVRNPHSSCRGCASGVRAPTAAAALRGGVLVRWGGRRQRSSSASAPPEYGGCIPSGSTTALRASDPGPRRARPHDARRGSSGATGRGAFARWAMDDRPSTGRQNVVKLPADLGRALDAAKTASLAGARCFGALCWENGRGIEDGTSKPHKPS